MICPATAAFLVAILITIIRQVGIAANTGEHLIGIGVVLGPALECCLGFLGQHDETNFASSL